MEDTHQNEIVQAYANKLATATHEQIVLQAQVNSLQAENAELLARVQELTPDETIE